MHCFWLFLVSLVLCVGNALGADTVETWEVGAGNFELFSEFQGVGSTAPDQGVASAMLMGWGVANRFSAFAATGVSAAGNLSSAEAEIVLGAFGTPYDSDHLDFDLGLDMIASGPGLKEALIVPAFEINLDRTPDLSSVGLYLRGAAEIAGGEFGGDEVHRHVDLAFTLGSYFTLSPSQQILLQYNLTVHDEPEPGIPDVERGALALGYNAMLSDILELVSEVWLDIPQDDEDAHLGLKVGIIAALLPSGN